MKLSYIIFYSWQSDLETKLNRSFIEESLKKAASAISTDDVFKLEALIDRDTYGLPGSPSIVDSITTKISKADIFVCDVSIINKKSKHRSTPNPNVMFELGYAVALLGWERIIMVQNSAYGGPEILPFDLRGRRIVQYNTNELEKSGIKKNLKDQLIHAFQVAFKHYLINGLGDKEVMLWWGSWELHSNSSSRGGNLYIYRSSSKSFFFEISIYDGARGGQVSGKAKIVTPNSAFSQIDTMDSEICEIVFRRRLDGNNWIINIDEGLFCKYFHGVGTAFSGTYIHKPEEIVDLGFIDELDLNEIGRISGKFIFDLLSCFNQIREEDSLDNSITKVIVGGTKGLYTIKESIVCKNEIGDIWAAFIDSNSDVVRYFTNVYSDYEKLPKSIEKWRSRFQDKKIIYGTNA